MVWDVTSPLDTDPIRQGANSIRAFKSDLQAALVTEGVFPGADTTNPVYRWKPRRGTTGTRPANDATNPGSLYANTDTISIQVDSGTDWIDITTPIGPGTVMVFYQASAPSGWTQVVTQNDKALRVVSGTGGSSGGTNAMSSGLSHTHTLSGSSDFAVLTGRISVISGLGPSGNRLMDDIASSPAVKSVDDHTHALSVASAAASAPTLQYIDVIICSKNT